MVVALLINTVAVGQSLADVARQERARRDETPQAKVYTTESILALFRRAVAEVSASPDSVAPDQEAPAEFSPEDIVEPWTAADTEEAWSAWEDAVTARQTVIQDLEGRQERQQLVITQSPNTQTDLGEPLEELEQIRTALEEARTELERLELSAPGEQ